MAPDEIKTRREEAGLSQDALGAALGVDGRTIYRWEAGEIIPKTRDLIAIDVVLSEQVGAKSPSKPSRKSNSR